MATFTNEDLAYLAQLSAIKVDDEQGKLLVKQLQQVIAFVDQLQEISVAPQPPYAPCENVFRDDQVFATSLELPLGQAPQRQERYFAVPPILE